MPNKMLIDASHPEETRVVVVHGNRIEEFDFESQDKKQLKGNIYLARVTRVEPSLQAAFVEYGGNRHGFLAFSEIHPDYYQIPVADRQAILRAEAEAAEQDDEDEDGERRQDRNRGRRRRRGGKSRDRDGDDAPRSASGDGEDAVSSGASDSQSGETSSEDHGDDEHARSGEHETQEHETSSDAAGEDEVAASDDHPASDDPQSSSGSMAAAVDADVVSEPAPRDEASSGETSDNDRGMVEQLPDANGDEQEIESVGAEDAMEEARNRRKPLRRHYKIQEVIKRRQILLVQVVKEERGNKGAALTTYLSLAGRYSVLMPNTARGGGISRKITNAQDRKRLKEVVQDLEVPQGMGVILRTAGESRTKAEIKRDYEYLMRLWETVRTLTLQSTAPTLVYEEGSLIKRSVRDLYNKDIEEIIVSGDEGYREAKDFMRMLMPSHAKVVQPHRDTTPIFVRHGIEAQLDRMLQPQVTLKSGGYIIINQTEALVAIDVNSGRSTKEHSIEETALHTNLEAAEEVARQLRLRDLAGLIVIDFIDMEENRNNRAVEKRLKDHLKNDRARIQLGRISHFGLMEMSRQRIRASVLESTMKPCPHCGGTGHVRSDSSVALLVVRAIEEFLIKDSRCHIIAKTPAATAMYVLNHKRSTLADLEARFGLTITIEVDDSVGAQHIAIFRGAVAEKPIAPAAITTGTYTGPQVDDDEDEEIAEETEASDEPVARSQEPARQPREEDGEHRGDRKRRKRRRRRGGRDRDGSSAHPSSNNGQAANSTNDPDHDGDGAEDEAGEQPTMAAASPAPSSEEGERKKRRRGKRGGKRNRAEGGEASAERAAGSATDGEDDDVVASDYTDDATPAEIEAVTVEAIEPDPVVAETEEPAKPKRASRARKPKAAEAEGDDAASTAAPAPRSRRKAAPKEEAASADVIASEPAAASTAEPEAAPASDEVEAAPQAAPKPQPEAPRSEPILSSSVPADAPRKGGWWQRKSFF